MTTRFADHLLTGDHASRPVATAVPDGTLYACSDHDLIYQSDGAVWATWLSPSTVAALNDLSDVDTTGQGSGDVLTYDGADWVPQAPAGGATFSYLGYNTIGGSQEAVTDLRVYMKRVTVASTGLIASIGAYLNQTTDNVFSLSVALMTDAAAVPDKLIAYNHVTSTSFLLEISAVPAYAAGWVHVPIGKRVDAGDYWLCIQCTVPAGTLQLYYDGSGSDRYYSPGAAWFSHAGRYAETDSTRKYSIRADFLA